MKRLAMFLAVTLIVVTVFSSMAVAQIKLDYWHALGGDYGKHHQALIEEFNEAHPDIHVEPLYSGSLWTFRDKLLTSVAGGQAPDIAYVDQFWAPQLARTDSIVRMQDLIEGPNGIDAKDMLPVAWETASVDGEVWVMPYAMSNQVLFYNKDMFREVGLDPEKPPTTWDELLECAKALTRDVDNDGRVDEWGLTMPLRANQGTVYFFISFLWQAGGELYNEDFTEVAFNSDAGVKAVTFLQDLVHKHKVVPLAPPSEGFVSQRIAMELGTSSRLGQYRAQADFEMGVAHLPAGEQKVTGLGGGNLAIFKNTPEKEEAAWTFIKWMTRPEANLKWSKLTGYIPLRLSVLNSDDYQQHLADDPLTEVFVSQLDYMRPRPNVLHYADMSRILGLAAENAVFGRIDPQTVLDTAAREANDFVRQLQ